MSFSGVASPLGQEALSRIRLVAGRVMNLLETDPVWSEPAGKIAVFAFITQSVACRVEAGETDEKDLLDIALAEAFMTYGKAKRPVQPKRRWLPF